LNPETTALNPSYFDFKLYFSPDKENKMKTLILVLCLFLSACGGGGSGDSTPTPKAVANPPTAVVFDYSKYTACTSSSCAGDLISKFNVDKFFWNSNIVYDESLLPVQGVAAYNLWRPVFEIQLVRNRATGVIFAPGRDYQVVNNQFVIPAGSTIPQVAVDYVHTMVPNTPPQFQPYTKNGGPLRIDSTYQSNQIAVTYSSAQFTADPPVTINPPRNLIGKLKAGQAVTITFIGDSITAGSNSSKDNGQAPMQPGYAALVTAYLSQQYPGQVYTRNKAVGGTSSVEGAANASALVGDTPTDYLVIPYGMNDAVAPTTAAAFSANLTTMINAAKALNPNVEILLVSSWPGNPDWQPMSWTPFVWYNGDMYGMTGDPKISVANVTSAVWDTMLTRKSFYDVTANGVNHPSDFVYVVYAQVVLKSILSM
jgi:hypothetical protein